MSSGFCCIHFKDEKLKIREMNALSLGHTE